MSLDLCLKQLHVVHIKVFYRMQYIRLLLFYSVILQSVISSPSFSSPANSTPPLFWWSVIFQSCKFQSPVPAIVSKAVKLLWFLKKLKRARVSVKDLVYYYQTVSRPVLEYGCPAWQVGTPPLLKNRRKLSRTSSAVCSSLSSETFRTKKPVAYLRLQAHRQARWTV